MGELAKVENPNGPDQPSMVSVPDSPEHASHGDEIQSALKAMEAAAQPSANQEESPPQDSIDNEDAPKAEPADPAQKPQADADSAEAAVVEEPAGSKGRAWATIKQTEKRMRHERQQLKEEMHRFRMEREQFAQQAQQQQDLKQRMAQDPFGTLQGEFGLTYDKLTNMALQPGAQQSTQAQPNGEITKVMEEVQQLRQEIAASRQKDYVSDYQTKIRSEIKSDDYELLRTLPNAEQEVFSYAAGYAQKTGELLSAKEAADTMQDQWRDHIRKISSNKAARQLLGLGETNTASEPTGQNGSAAGTAEPSTVTNSMTTPPPKGLNKEAQPMSHHDEVKRALAALSGDPWATLE